MTITITANLRVDIVMVQNNNRLLKTNSKGYKESLGLRRL
jgi:hypothetical protein